MHSLEQTWVLKQGRYFTTCILSTMRLLLQEVPLDGGSPAAQGYRGRWWCPCGAPPSPRLCLPAPHHQSYENESPEPPLGQQHSWPLPCLSLSRLPLSQGSSGNEYAAVNCRGALRCSAARTCDGCETRMSLFFFFSLAAGLKCPCCQDFSSQREESPRFRASPRKTCRCLHLAAGLGLNTRPLNLTSLGKLQSRLQSPHVPSRGCLPGGGESPAQCSSASLLCCTFDPPLPSLAPFQHPLTHRAQQAGSS